MNEQIYACPYCGNHGLINKFFISNKQGISRKLFGCKICNNTMRKGTLSNNLSVYEWGEWIYLCITMYKKSYKNPNFSFYNDKLHWNIEEKYEYFKKNLYLLGASDDFWNGFKEAQTFSYSKKRNILYQLEERMYILNNEILTHYQTFKIEQNKNP